MTDSTVFLGQVEISKRKMVILCFCDGKNVARMMKKKQSLFEATDWTTLVF